MPRNLIADADRERVRELHTAGKNRNQIAKEIGRSGSTVTKLARELGLSFDRSATAAATAAKVIDAKARRAALAVELLGDAERLRAQLFAPTVLHSFGGKENTHNSVEVPRPQFGDQRNIMQATSTAIAASLRLDQHDGDGSAEQVGSLLGTLFDSISAKHREAEPDADAD